MKSKRGVALLVLVVMSLALGFLALRYPLVEWLVGYANWARTNPWQSVPLFILVYIVVTVLMAPGWVLTVFGGYLYGWLAGTAVVSMASLLGALAAFVAGRLLVREWVSERAGRFPRFAALDKAIAHRGFEVVFLTRVSAVFPYNLLNYLYSVTQIGIGRYALATWLGMLPVIALYVFAGATADDILALARGEADTGPIGIAAAILAVLGIVLVVVILTRTASRMLERDLAE